MTETRIYAACLASYNSGSLHGAWIDCEGKDAEALQIEINAMLAASRCPNVMRRKCPDCGHYQTDARPYSDAPQDECSECGDNLVGIDFKPSAEERAIHDTEGFEDTISGEWPDLAEVAAAAEGLHGDHREGFIYLCTDANEKPTDALDNADEVCIWHYTGGLHGTDERMLAEYAQEFYEDGGGLPDNIPEEIRNNIDWHGIAYDWQQNGAIAFADIDGERVLITNAAR